MEIFELPIIQERAEAIASPFNADNQARIKRIIFLKNREVDKIQTTTKLAPYSHFQVYPSGYSIREFDIKYHRFDVLVKILL